MSDECDCMCSFCKNTFAASKAEGQEIQDARDEVSKKYAAVGDTVYKDSCVPVCKLEELIKQIIKQKQLARHEWSNCRAHNSLHLNRFN